MIDYRKRERREPKEYIVTYSYYATPVDTEDDGVCIDEFFIPWQEYCYNEWDARTKAKEMLEDIVREKRDFYSSFMSGCTRVWGFRILSIEEKK